MCDFVTPTVRLKLGLINGLNRKSGQVVVCIPAIWKKMPAHFPGALETLPEGKVPRKKLGAEGQPRLYSLLHVQGAAPPKI